MDKKQNNSIKYRKYIDQKLMQAKQAAEKTVEGSPRITKRAVDAGGHFIGMTEEYLKMARDITLKGFVWGMNKFYN